MYLCYMCMYIHEHLCMQCTCMCVGTSVRFVLDFIGAFYSSYFRSFLHLLYKSTSMYIQCFVCLYAQ